MTGPEIWSLQLLTVLTMLTKLTKNIITLGHCFVYDAIRSVQHGNTLHYTFSWDKLDGTGEPQILVGSSEVSKASTSMAVLGEPLWFCSTLVFALLTYELLAKSRGLPVPSTSSQLKE